MKFSAILLFVLLPLFALCQESAMQNYKIYDTRNQKVISADNIISNMDQADVLFFGEEHNDSTGHQLEYILLKSASAMRSVISDTTSSLPAAIVCNMVLKFRCSVHRTKDNG